jgi:hypothetical protein
MTIRERKRGGRGLSANGGYFPVKGGKAGIGRGMVLTENAKIAKSAKMPS